MRGARRNLLRLARLARQDFGPNLSHGLLGDGARIVFGGAIILGAAGALETLAKGGGLGRAACRERLRSALVADELLDAAGSVFLLGEHAGVPAPPSFPVGSVCTADANASSSTDEISSCSVIFVLAGLARRAGHAPALSGT